jgi:simple sugar transport system substrate-binding protein
MIVAMLAACSPAATTAPVAPAAAAAKPVKANADLKFVTVVKSIAFNWFKRMEVGIKNFAKDTGINAIQEGPDTGDVAKQISIVEDVLAGGVDVLGVVPNQVEPMEPVMKKAMDAGVVVITHEASTVKNANYDIEAFDNKSYGEMLMKDMATCMGGTGLYVEFVGTKQAATHMEWANAAIAYQKANYPKMTLATGDVVEDHESQDESYTKMQSLMKTYPDIKGVQGADAGSVVSAAKVVQEAGLAGKVCLYGTSIPSYAGDLGKTGVIQEFTAWDPALAGYAMDVVALKVLKGEPITDGMDLKVDGYNKIHLVKNDNGVPVIYGAAWLKMNKDNMDQYAF